MSIKLDINAYNVYYISIRRCNMPKKEIVILPKMRDTLGIMGSQIKMARLRRNLPASLVAERAGVSRATVVAIEQGKSSVSMGSYCAVLHALNGLDADLLKIAKDDELGKKIQDLNLPTRARIKK